MATDLKWLQGRIAENPKDERKDLDRLLVGFLQALVEEQLEESRGDSTDGTSIRHLSQSGAV